MSKQIGELSCLIVDHLFGELASRVLEAFFVAGRLTFLAIRQHTLLSPRQLRHSLAVLIQEQLVLWYTSDGNGVTSYEANIDNCYNLIRSGKYLTIVEERLQEPASSVVSYLITQGHSSVDHLIQACKPLDDGPMQKKPLRNGFKSKEADKQNSNGDPTDILNGALCDLLGTGHLHIVHESNFRPIDDDRLEAEKLETPQDGLSSKMKQPEAQKYEDNIHNRQFDWRHGTDAERAEVSNLKESKFRGVGKVPESVLERPQLTSVSNLTEGDNLRGNVVLRINHDKLSIMARNERLVRLAEECVGTLTSRLYAVILEILERDQLQCKEKTFYSEDVKKLEDKPKPRNLPQISTNQLKRAILSSPDPLLQKTTDSKSTELVDNLGYVSEKNINLAQYDHPKKRRRKAENPDERDSDDSKVAGFVSPDEDDSSEEEGDGSASGGDTDSDDLIASNEFQPVNAESKKRRRSHGFTSQKAPLDPLMQHLMLLATHKHKFLHHLPATLEADERWSVDFHALSNNLRKHIILQTITSRFTPLAARIVRILRQKGKVDEKTLASLGLFNQKTMRALLAKMNRQGLVEVQEIPKDTNRNAIKVIFLWFFDEERCRKRILDDTYKAMCRVLQRIGVEREKVRGTVEKSERIDVEGNEDQLLGESEKVALAEWRAKQEKLLGELMRLDDLVAVLRDF